MCKCIPTIVIRPFQTLFKGGVETGLAQSQMSVPSGVRAQRRLRFGAKRFERVRVLVFTSELRRAVRPIALVARVIPADDWY